MNTQGTSIANRGYSRDSRAVLPAVLAASALLLGGCGGSAKTTTAQHEQRANPVVAGNRVQAVASKYQNLIARIRATTPQTQALDPKDCPPPQPEEGSPQESYITTTTTIAAANNSGEYQLVVNELPGANGRPDPTKVVGINLVKIAFKGCNNNQPFEEVSIDTDEVSQSDPVSLGWSVNVEHSTDGVNIHYDDSYATSTAQGMPLLTVSGLTGITSNADAILNDALHRAPVSSVQP